MKRNIKKSGLAVSLILALTLSMTGCGGKDGAENAQNTSTSVENVSGANARYVASYTELSSDGSDKSYDNISIVDDTFFAVESSYNDETEEFSSFIMAQNITTGEEKWKINVEDCISQVAAEAMGHDENQQLNAYVMTLGVEENEITALATVYLYDQEYNLLNSQMVKVKLDMDGNVLSGLMMEELGNLKNDQGDAIYFSNAQLTKDGKIVFASDQSVYVVSEEGNLLHKIDLDNWAEGIYKLKNDEMYVKYWNNTSGTPCFSKIDLENGKLAEGLENLPMNINGCSVCPENDNQFAIYNSDAIYIYDYESQTYEKEMSFMDCDIMGDYIRSLYWISDGHFMAVSVDWNTQETELIDLTRSEAGAIDEKIQVNVATLYADQEYTAAIVKYNKSQEKYHINTQVFYDYNTDMDYEAAMTNMQNAIIGDNPPDIVILQGMDSEIYANKDVFADLKPYVEKSEKLSLDDYYENVIEAYTYKDKLISIPSNFSISTFAVSAKDFDKMGWTVDEMIKYDYSHPDANLISYASRSSMYDWVLGFTMEKFVNWETGECNFDSPEFKQILEYLAGFSAEYDWESDMDSDSEPIQIQEGKLLAVGAYIGSINETQVYDAMFGGVGAATFIGYPTLDGTPTAALLEGSGGMAITEKGNKDAAWDFVEFYLTRDDKNDMFSYGLPANKKELQKLIDAELEKAKSGDECGSGVGYGDWDYTYHYSTEAEIDTLLEIFKTAKPQPKQNGDILAIITEEAEAFYTNQKSVDEVAGIIQNRVNIFVSENM